MKNNTITAISTALGPGAISIVRLSGPLALIILNKVFVKGKFVSNLRENPNKFEANSIRDNFNKDELANNLRHTTPEGDISKNFESHKIYYGFVVDGETKIDEVLVSVMLAPKTYTKEDMVEINCHGGDVSAMAVLSILLKNGASMAEPGEFTKRAFLNGRLDLSQAEAVIDIINSRSNISRQLSLNVLDGKLGKQIKKMRSNLLFAIATLEVAIDYPEDGYFTQMNEIEQITKDTLFEVNNLLKNSKWDSLLKNGLDTVILGRPNVGKSSLLNALIGEERAIVTNIEGTTRDIITANTNIDNIPLNIIDTAGIRDTVDEIEKIGQDMAFAKLSSADLILLVIDGSNELTSKDKELIELVKEQNHIIVLNKADLGIKLNLSNSVEISAANGDIGELHKEITKKYLNENITTELTLINMRHKEALFLALEALKRAEEAILLNSPEEFISLDLTQSYEALGEILGEELSESIIDKIFSEFCLGK
ncbi:MAG: tRNA uridine-5-carboxymethylaminomethyl(34) synthesis GTPase MnmE [Defluviitaleaceae bacterium]|nr:tRNA uridine-5-carboxymethylaminomethyl(34) synthesis GTPase MnmE [Defluviitaleaceae bacterium]